MVDSACRETGVVLSVLSMWINDCVLDESVVNSTELFFNSRMPVPGLSLEKSRWRCKMCIRDRGDIARYGAAFKIECCGSIEV